MRRLVFSLISLFLLWALPFTGALAEEPRSVQITIINPSKGSPAERSETPSPSVQSSRDRSKLNEIYERCINEAVEPSRGTNTDGQENLTYLAQITKQVMASRKRVDPKFFELVDQVINGSRRMNSAEVRNKLRSAATLQGVTVPPPYVHSPSVTVIR